jgi:hypothetical protein
MGRKTYACGERRDIQDGHRRAQNSSWLVLLMTLVLGSYQTPVPGERAISIGGILITRRTALATIEHVWRLPKGWRINTTQAGPVNTAKPGCWWFRIHCTLDTGVPQPRLATRIRQVLFADTSTKV